MSDPTARLQPGSRVVVRYRRAAPADGPPLTDVVGELVSADAESVVVAARQGPVRVPRAAVVAAKTVPPKPSRRGAPHLALSVEDLQRVMVDGWPPLERAALGDWVLRAAAGFSRRANSVLPVGSPGIPLAEAVDQAEGWYAARGLPCVVSLSGPVGFAIADDPLGELLLRLGYAPQRSTLVMTAAGAAVAQAATGVDPSVSVSVSESLTAQWLSAYGRQRTIVPGATEAVLTGSPEQLFASVDVDGENVALARLSMAHAWGGLATLWVDPGQRRRGLAQAVTAELARRAGPRGIQSLFLQVERDNAPAVRLYERLGFTVHHAYEYLVQPETR